MNIAGVEASPQSSTVTPAAVRAAVTASRRRGPETRLSRPTETVSSPAGLPVRRASHAAKPAAIAFTRSSVRSSGSPGTPSTATPRMSVPLLKCFHSLFSIACSVLSVSGPPCIGSPFRGGRSTPLYRLPAALSSVFLSGRRFFAGALKTLFTKAAIYCILLVHFVANALFRGNSAGLPYPPHRRPAAPAGPGHRKAEGQEMEL